MKSMTLEVDRAALASTRISVEDVPSLNDGEVLLSIASFALTSNNITYAVFGDGMNYWDFFPVIQVGDGIAWGRVPVWGFAEVTDSRHALVPVGKRVYGYFPMSTHLIVTPGRCDARGLTDISAHRAPMAGAYNRYVFTDNDPIYRGDCEAQQMVLWPLFMTSFMIDDFLAHNVLEDDSSSIATVIISSASSKTAIGAAYLLVAREGITVIGLTSSKNAEFVRELGCYHRVITYDTLSDLPSGVTCDVNAYIDIAGDRSVNRAVHAHYGDELDYSMGVGGTHWDAPAETSAGRLAGPKPEFFFAPSHIALRNKEWGGEGLGQRVGQAWDKFSQWSTSWMEVLHTSAPAQVEALYQEVLHGRIDPAVGHICSMT